MKRIYLFLLTMAVTIGCMKTPYFDKQVEVTVHLSISSESAGTLEQTKAVESILTETINDLWVVQFDGTANSSKIVKTQFIMNYNPSSTVSLNALNKSCRICFLANTADSFLLSNAVGTTYTQFLARTYGISGQEDIFPDGYSVLSGEVNSIITDATQSIEECQLKRNYARIVFNVINNTAITSDPLTIDGITVGNVPCTMAYNSLSSVATGYSGATMDYDNLSGVKQGNMTSFVFYLPPNCQGTITNSDETKKNGNAPAKATYVTVSATQSSGTGMEYKFYLGSNLTNNFNIEANNSYSYTIEFNGIGNPSTDSRVSKLSGPPNCYVVHTNETVQVKLSKVDEFWGNNGYENNPSYTLGTNGTWIAEVLWSDIPLSNIKMIKSSGKGSSDYFSCYASVEGNFVVAVKVGTQIVWSYHIWVCNADLEANAVEWNGNVFMDRNIGATTILHSTSNLYYQFGRKDPFPANQTIYGTAKTVILNDKTGTSNMNNMPYSVNNPTVFIGTGYYESWTENDIYSPRGNVVSIWHDPKSVVNGAVQMGYKSFFDPCPAGWKIPEYGCYDTSVNPLYVSSDKARILTTGLYLPYYGYLDDEYSLLEEYEKEGEYWNSDNLNVVYGYGLGMTTYSYVCDHVNDKGEGRSVRCIKE